MPAKHKLISLQIPSGWLVVKNAFYDIEHSNKMEPEDFSADMLFLKRNVMPPRQDIYIIGLDWLPENDPDGRYRLIAAVDSFENEFGCFESRDRYAIQQELNRWLDVLSGCFKVDEARRLINQAS